MARFATRLQLGVRPRDLGGLVDLAIEVDNHQREWRAGGEQVAHPASPQSPLCAVACLHVAFSHLLRPRVRAPSASCPCSWAAPNCQPPRDISVSPRVLWPGGSFHCQMSLVAQRLSSSAHAGVLASTISSCPSSSWVILPGTLLWAHGSLPLTLLVDSGADDSFFNENVASRQDFC